MEIEPHTSTPIAIGEGYVRTYVNCTVTGLTFRLVQKGSFQMRTLGEDLNQIEIDFTGTREGSTVEEILFEATLTRGQDYDYANGKRKTDKELVESMPAPDKLVVNTKGGHWPKSVATREATPGKKDTRSYYNLTDEGKSLKKVVTNIVVNHKRYNSPELNQILSCIPADMKSEEERRRQVIEFQAEEKARRSKAMGAGDPFATTDAGFSGNA